MSTTESNDNTAPIPAWNTILFQKFCRFGTTVGKATQRSQFKSLPIVRFVGRPRGRVLIAAGLLICTAAAHADAVTDWNAITETTVVQRDVDPFLRLRSFAITEVAVFEAVNAIVGDYEPYLGTVRAPLGASPEAAAIAAAHRVLVTLHPDRAAYLDARRAVSLAQVAHGQAKTDGIAVGEAAALALIAARTNDGSDDDTLFTPGTEPGQYRPTPPDLTPEFRPGLGQVQTFGIKNGAQFRVPPPPALDSRAYARDYHEVQRLGDVNATECARPQDRADVARFYAAAEAELYHSAARQVSEAQGRTLSENARNFALLSVAIFDAAVAVFDSKYHYNYWRPVTAIQAGGEDGNDATDPDSNWLSFVFTPPFPSYPSGHAGFGGAARYVLEHLYGIDGHSITLTNAQVPELVLHYTSWKEITDDIDDGRIYGGVHYRFDQEQAARQGRQIGNYILRHILRPVHWRRHDQAGYDATEPVGKAHGFEE